MKKISILLADDHKILRSGLVKLLNEQPDMEVISEASDGHEAVAKSVEMAPDVLLLDISMPGISGIAALRMIKSQSPGVLVLVLTMHEDEGHFIEALKAGAVGYIPKKAADSELITAIRAVANGEVYIHNSFTKTMVDQVTRDETKQQAIIVDKYDHLSQREREVLTAVAQGYTNKQVADQFYLSVKTVETYKARIMDKLNLSSRAELVRFALQRGLLG